MVENIIKQRRRDLNNILSYYDIPLLLYQTILLEPSWPIIRCLEYPRPSFPGILPCWLPRNTILLIFSHQGSYVDRHPRLLYPLLSFFHPWRYTTGCYGRTWTQDHWRFGFHRRLGTWIRRRHNFTLFLSFTTSWLVSTVNPRDYYSLSTSYQTGESKSKNSSETHRRWRTKLVGITTRVLSSPFAYLSERSWKGTTILES